MLKYDQNAQHFQDHIMSYHKHDYGPDPLVWPDCESFEWIFKKEKAKMDKIV